MSDSTVRGRFVWHELMTTDPKSATGFFTKVVGWKTQPWPQDPTYTMFVAGKRPMAGVLPLPEDAKAMGAPPNWLTYIGTPNVDETAQRIESLGGKVLRAPSDIPTIGRFAIVRDPQGAVFAPFTPMGGAPAGEEAPAVGDFSWHELATTDWRSALSFYKQLFGWDDAGSMEMGPEMGTYQMFGKNGRTLGGMFNKSSQQPGPPSWLPYIRVTESKGAAATVKKLGGKIINGPMQVPGGDWTAQGLDLQGAIFAVHSVKTAAAKKPVSTKSSKKSATAKQKMARPAKKAAKASRPRAAKKAAAARSGRTSTRAGRSVKKTRRSAKRRR